jgi:MFS family permease
MTTPVESTVSDSGPTATLLGEKATLRSLHLRGLLVTFAGVSFAVPTLIGLVQGLYLALQVQKIDPTGQLGDLALIVSTGAFVAIFASPISGVLSDRTRTRLGARIPWMLGGAVLTLIAAALIGFANTITQLVIFWIVLQISTNFILTPLLAYLPDRVPLLRRGSFSAAFGVGALTGSVLGVAVGAAFAGAIPIGYTIVGVAILVFTVVFALVNKRSNVGESKAPVDVKAILKTFWVNPIKFPNFAWTFAARFAFFMGYFVVQAYSLYWLQSYVGLGKGAVSAAPILAVCGLVGMVISTLTAGLLFDKIGKTKPMIYITTAVLAIGLLTPLVSHTYLGVVVYAFVSGLGFGAYLSVDQVLVTQVLPSGREAAKDLGIVNISSALPQTIAIAIAGAVVAIGGYGALFPVGAGLVVLGALFIIPIRNVR